MTGGSSGRVQTWRQTMQDILISCAVGQCSEHITIDRRHASNFEGRDWSCISHRRDRAA
jgi:hypothetical protein